MWKYKLQKCNFFIDDEEVVNKIKENKFTHIEYAIVNDGHGGDMIVAFGRKKKMIDNINYTMKVKHSPGGLTYTRVPKDLYTLRMSSFFKNTCCGILTCIPSCMDSNYAELFRCYPASGRGCIYNYSYKEKVSLRQSEPFFKQSKLFIPMVYFESTYHNFLHAKTSYLSFARTKESNINEKNIMLYLTSNPESPYVSMIHSRTHKVYYSKRLSILKKMVSPLKLEDFIFKVCFKIPGNKYPYGIMSFIHSSVNGEHSGEQIRRIRPSVQRDGSDRVEVTQSETPDGGPEEGIE